MFQEQAAMAPGISEGEEILTADEDHVGAAAEKEAGSLLPDVQDKISGSSSLTPAEVQADLSPLSTASELGR